MIAFEIERNPRLIVSRVSGGIGALDVADFLQALLRHPHFDPEMNSLIIAEDMASVPPFSMLRYLKPLVATWTAHRGRAKWAFVLPNEVARVLAETELKHLTLNRVQARCFVNVGCARGWLASKGADALAEAPKPIEKPTAPAPSARLSR